MTAVKIAGVVASVVVAWLLIVPGASAQQDLDEGYWASRTTTLELLRRADDYPELQKKSEEQANKIRKLEVEVEHLNSMRAKDKEMLERESRLKGYADQERDIFRGIAERERKEACKAKVLGTAIAFAGAGFVGGPLVAAGGAVAGAVVGLIECFSGQPEIPKIAPAAAVSLP